MLKNGWTFFCSAVIYNHDGMKLFLCEIHSTKMLALLTDSRMFNHLQNLTLMGFLTHKTWIDVSAEIMRLGSQMLNMIFRSIIIWLFFATQTQMNHLSMNTSYTSNEPLQFRHNSVLYRRNASLQGLSFSSTSFFYTPTQFYFLLSIPWFNITLSFKLTRIQFLVK